MEQFRHLIPITVRTRDIDAWGHVNNSVYFTYMEIMEMARADYMSKVILESPIRDLSDVGVILAEASCQYKKPILFGQLLEVGTRVVEMANSSWVVEHRMEADGQLAALGKGVLVHYDYESGQSVRIPDLFRARIEFFESKELCAGS